MEETCVWTGKSGAVYKYWVHELPVAFEEGHSGNYIYAKRVGSRWIPIYIGQGVLSERCTDQHHQARAIRERGATHIHAHLNSTETGRRAEEQDLLGNYPIAYTPIGCNVKSGG